MQSNIFKDVSNSKLNEQVDPMSVSSKIDDFLLNAKVNEARQTAILTDQLTYSEEMFLNALQVRRSTQKPQHTQSTQIADAKRETHQETEITSSVNALDKRISDLLLTNHSDRGSALLGSGAQFPPELLEWINELQSINKKLTFERDHMRNSLNERTRQIKMLIDEINLYQRNEDFFKNAVIIQQQNQQYNKGNEQASRAKQINLNSEKLNNNSAFKQQQIGVPLVLEAKGGNGSLQIAANSVIQNTSMLWRAREQYPYEAITAKVSLLQQQQLANLNQNGQQRRSKLSDASSDDFWVNESKSARERGGKANMELWVTSAADEHLQRMQQIQTTSNSNEQNKHSSEVGGLQSNKTPIEVKKQLPVVSVTTKQPQQLQQGSIGAGSVVVTEQKQKEKSNLGNKNGSSMHDDDADSFWRAAEID